MACSACFLAAFAVFLASASPTVSFEDTGELITAAAGLGVTHPPGYPWYTLLGRLFIFLPAGDPAFRLNLMSAAFGAAAVTAVFAMVGAVLNRLPETPGPLVRRLGPPAAALALVTSKTLWWQAGIAEKYTISLALMSLTVLVILRSWADRRASGLNPAAFLAGLSLSHHLHGLYLIPLLTAAAWKLCLPGKRDGETGPGEERWRTAGRRAAVLAVLFSLPVIAKTVAIPVRAAADPRINWGVPDRVDRWYRYLAARQYRFIMLASKGPADIPRRVLEQVAKLPLVEFGPVLAFAVPGLAVAARIPGILPGAALAFGANVFFAASYDTPEIERYYLFSYGLLAALIGLGFARMARMNLAWCLVALAALAVPAWRNGATSPRARHYLAHDFAVNQLAPLPARAILICEGDDQAFPMFYLNSVTGYRPDIRIVPMPDACSSPSYARMARQHPDLVLPPFEPDPGKHLPRIIAANSRFRSSFYSPGCTGGGSEHHLIPFGVTFAASAERLTKEDRRRMRRRFPSLRLRGVVTAEKYGDSVTLRAVRNYGFAIGFDGARAIEEGDYERAEMMLTRAMRLPMEDSTRAASLSSLASLYARTKRPELCEAAYRKALRLEPDFAPALIGLGSLLLGRGEREAAAQMLAAASRSAEELTPGLRRELAALLARTR